MEKIDKLLATAKRQADIIEERREARELKELDEAFERMTTGQLYELEDEKTTDERWKEIFASVGALHLIESG